MLPGETVGGQVTIRTDKSFECKKVILKVVGKERTEHGSGEYQITQEKYHINKVFKICEEGIIPEGITRIPFAFTLP